MATTPKATMHGSDPKVTPVVKDVYKDDVLVTSNEVKKPSPVQSAATEYLKKFDTDTKSVIGTITKTVSSDDQGLTADFGSIKKRLETSFGIGGSTTGLSNVLKNDIGNALATLTGEKDSKVLFNKVATAVKDTDITSAASIVGMVNTLSGESKVFTMLDITAQAAFVRGISKKLIAWGVPDMLDKFIESIEDVATKNALLEENAIQASSIGDLTQTNYFCTRMGQLRASAVKDTLIMNLMINYEIDPNEARSYVVLGEELLAFYLWLDPLWDADSKDVSLKSLEFHTYANEDVVDILRYTDSGLDVVLGSQVILEKPLETAGDLFPTMIAWQHG